MLRTLYLKETLRQFYSLKFIFMLVLIIILSTSSVLVMTEDYTMRLENYEILKPEKTDTIALKMPSATSIFVKGLDEQLGRSHEIESFGSVSVGSSQSSANRLAALFNRLDMHFIVQVLMSLAAILFSFDLISDEKRNGTLKLNLANGVSRGNLLLSKWLSAFTVISIAIIASILIALILVSIIVPDAMSGDLYLRMLIFTFIAIVYSAVFISIGMMISTLTNRPSVSLVVSILTWAVLIFLIPGFASIGSKNLVGGKQLEEYDFKVKEIWTSAIFKFNNSGEEGRIEDLFEEIKIQLGDLYGEYINVTSSRIDWFGKLSAISPAGPFNFLSWGVAGNSPVDSLEYQKQVLQYRNVAVQDAMKRRDVYRSGDEEQIAKFQVTPFQYIPRSLSQYIFDEFILHLALLIFMCIVYYIISFYAFIRYDVR